MIHKITEIIDKPPRDFIYQILRYIPLGFCVDIGAAAGHLTRSIRLAGVVQGIEPGWENFTGYSSLGYLSPDGDRPNGPSENGIQRSLKLFIWNQNLKKSWTENWEIKLNIYR